MDRLDSGVDARVRLAGSHRELVGRADRAADQGDLTALDFIAVNDTHLLCPYRQGALWLDSQGVTRLSGVASLELNAPYVQWLRGACKRLQAAGDAQARSIAPERLDETLGEEWRDWIPAAVAWIPFSVADGRFGLQSGGLFLARDEAWSDAEIDALAGWVRDWARLRHYTRLKNQPAGALAGLRRRLRAWRMRLAVAGAILLLLAITPVKLSILAPAELVPADPMPVRAPLEGVVRQFHVRPNEAVRAGQPLFSLDTLQLGSRLEVAQQALATAEAELRQLDQQALVDPKARSALAAARGTVAERRTEVSLLKSQWGRTTIAAQEDGFALFDDPSQWVGRPVAVGERIMRLASANDIEVEAWIPIGDAIPLPKDAQVRLYLSASPLDPVGATAYYVSHEAVRRPDGNYAFRVRAKLTDATRHRIGLKGTARINGDEVSLLYWLARRPLATVREFFAI